jgi:trimeric autotransporter adhesin
MKPNKIHKILAGLFLAGLALFASDASAQTWSNPTQAPTGGNASAPINVSSTAQTKVGSLLVYGLRSFVDGIFDGKVGVGMTNPSYKLDVLGSVGATAYFYTSDKSLKTDVRPIEGALAGISKLQGVTFAWKKDGTKSMGLVAQDVEKVYPELVSENEDGVKSVQYGNLVAPLIEAIKEQQREIESLRKEVEALKAR